MKVSGIIDYTQSIVFFSHIFQFDLYLIIVHAYPIRSGKDKCNFDTFRAFPE